MSKITEAQNKVIKWQVGLTDLLLRCLLLLYSFLILTEHSQAIYNDCNGSRTQNNSKDISPVVAGNASVETSKTCIKNTTLLTEEPFHGFRAQVVATKTFSKMTFTT